MLIMAAMSDACDIFNLMRDGYVADVLPCECLRIAAWFGGFQFFPELCFALLVLLCVQF